MAWLAVDDDNKEYVYDKKPVRAKDSKGCYWDVLNDCWYIELPKGSIKKLIGRDLTWEDEAVELKEE